MTYNINKILYKIKAIFNIKKIGIVIYQNTNTQILGENFNYKISFDETLNIFKTSNYIYNFKLKNDKLYRYMNKNSISFIFPLHLKSRDFGLLIIGDKIYKDFFDIEEQQILTRIIDFLEIAIDREFLFQENIDLISHLKEKIDSATKELENNNKKLEKANKDLKGLDQLKDDLISISSHELRTPASIVKGNVYMAQSTIKEYINTLPNNKKNNEYIEKLNRYIDRSIESIESEIRIINTLLEASRMGKSDVPIVQENVNLVSMIESQVDGFKKDAESKGLKIIYNKNDLPMAYGDRTKIEEVLGNLISNAIKYSERGAIEISTEKDEMFITVHIKDHGVGIPQKDIPELFQKFHRLNNYVGNPNDPKDTKHLLVRPGGTGLGLYVVKGLVERMGGKIWIDSKEGKGSTFSFTIPIATETNTNDNEFHSQDLLHKQTT
jgi:signal transduction histidine kinase